MARKLTVEIVGDASSLDRSFKQASHSANTFQREIDKTSRGALAGSGAFRSMGRSVAFASAGFLGGFGLSQALTQSVKGASDLEQQVSKTNVVFGSSADEVEKWSKSLADSFGLSERQALTLASTFGALFAPLGIVGKQAADQSKHLVELGADLASFYNTDVQDALAAIQSGLVGQARPLRRYGILVDAARVNQEALNETGKKSVTQLTNQEKVLARIKILFEDSAQAQGDFKRTSGQLAQQTKITQARLENLSDELGKNLIPALDEALKRFNKLADAFTRLPAHNQGLFQILREHGPPGLRGLLGQKEKQTDGLAGVGKAVTTTVQAVANAIADAQKKINKVADDAKRGGLTKERRQALIDLFRFRIDQAAATKGFADDLKALRRLQRFLEAQIKIHKTNLALQKDLLDVTTQIASIQQQQAEARKEAADKAAEAAKTARDARQFRLLGFGPTGEDLVPGVKSLKKTLASVNDAIEGSFLDTRKTRGLLGHIRQVLAGGLGSVSSEVRSKIQQILADLRAQLKQSSVDVTRFQKTATGQFKLAGATPAGRGVVINGGVHLHGIQNVQDLENALAKRSKQRAHARRATR